MSTRSLINAKLNDGKVHSIYVHFDGMDHLETLIKHYPSYDDVEALISLGNLSVLTERVAPKMGEHHNFDNQLDNVCVAYGRDRGEEDQEAKIYDSFEEAYKRNMSQEYVYEFEQIEDGVEYRRLKVHGTKRPKNWKSHIIRTKI